VFRDFFTCGLRFQRFWTLFLWRFINFRRILS
jgi:hypothetical protein